MYDDKLGFWAEIFKVGTQVLTSVAPALIQANAQRDLQERVNAQPQADIPDRSAAQAQRLARRQQNQLNRQLRAMQQGANAQSIIPGVSNAVLIGGAGLLLLAVVMSNRR